MQILFIRIVNSNLFFKQYWQWKWDFCCCAWRNCHKLRCTMGPTEKYCLPWELSSFRSKKSEITFRVFLLFWKRKMVMLSDDCHFLSNQSMLFICIVHVRHFQIISGIFLASFEIDAVFSNYGCPIWSQYSQFTSVFGAAFASEPKNGMIRSSNKAPQLLRQNQQHTEGHKKHDSINIYVYVSICI